MSAQKNLSQKIRRNKKKSLPLRRVSANHSAPLTIMAVVNSPYVGISRGRLGEGVYYRAKGNTNLRSYNPSPQNRRTVNQQSQRSLFSSAVKFFSRGVQNLFVFAYEDKRTQESDYNAFMRYNAKLGMYFGPEQNSNVDYPALGNWVLTSGSLQRVNYYYQDGERVFTFRAAAAGQDIDTVAQLTQLLVSTGDWQVGDILTILHIGSDSRVGSPAAPVTVGSASPVWIIQQLILDSADGSQLSNYGLTVTQDSFDVEVSCSVDFGLQIVGMSGFAVIHSRNVNGQLKVSDSTLVYSDNGVTALAYGRSETWRQVVMTAWQTEQLSVLQGGVAQRSAATLAPNIILQLQLPLSIGDLNGTTIVVAGDWTTAEIQQHLRFTTGDGTIVTSTGGTSQQIDFSDGTDTIFSLTSISTGQNWFASFLDPDGGGGDMVIASVYWD